MCVRFEEELDAIAGVGGDDGEPAGLAQRDVGFFWKPRTSV
jgi:hypothetical protein